VFFNLGETKHLINRIAIGLELRGEILPRGDRRAAVRRAVRPVPSGQPAVVPCRRAAVPSPTTIHEKSRALRSRGRCVTALVGILPSADRRMRIESTNNQRQYRPAYVHGALPIFLFGPAASQSHYWSLTNLTC
jgi:hypothetical protein